MKRYYHYIIEDSEARIEKYLKKQILNRNDPEYGAFYVSREYTEAKPVAYKVSTAIALFLNSESKYHLSPKIFEFVMPALSYIARKQRDDGTFDLVSCNFHSAPDTAFIIKHLANSHKLLDKYSVGDKMCGDIKQALHSIIEKAVKGMSLGGFHTPNHRWVIASVLSLCLSIIEEDKDEIRNHISSYLVEGIDCSEDGEYAERSAATYNLVNNSAMLFLYETLGKAEYLEYACRNLDMMLHFFEPDGSIFTDNSTRQDKGKKYYPRDYFYFYLYAANKTGNPKFDAAAHKIILDHMQRNLYSKEALAPDCLDLLMLNPKLVEYNFKGCGFPEKYDKYFGGSGLARIRGDKYSLSLIQNSTKPLVFSTEKTPIYMKIGVGYFEHRNFMAQSIEKKGESYTMEFSAVGWYYLPFESKPNTSDWWLMNNADRKKIYKNDIRFILTVSPKSSGITVNLKTLGCDNLLVRFEISIPPTSYIENENMFMDCVPGGATIIKTENITVHNHDDIIQIGPGFCSHKLIDGKFGSEPRNTYNHTIYFTATTNFEKEFSFDIYGTY